MERWMNRRLRKPPLVRLDEEAVIPAEEEFNGKAFVRESKLNTFETSKISVAFEGPLRSFRIQNVCFPSRNLKGVSNSLSIPLKTLPRFWS
jgi:hypothetical protein